MMIEEFEKLTGIYPSAEAYTVIESYYLDYPGTKQDFCKAFRGNTDGAGSANPARAEQHPLEERAGQQSRQRKDGQRDRDPEEAAGTRAGVETLRGHRQRPAG